MMGCVCKSHGYLQKRGTPRKHGGGREEARAGGGAQGVSIFGEGKIYDRRNLKYTILSDKVVPVNEFPEYMKTTQFIAWSPVEFRGRRNKSNVVKPNYTYFVLDFDYWMGKITEEQILDLAKELSSLVVTTKSGNYHVIVPLKVDSDYENILHRAKVDLDYEVLDNTIYDLARIFFVAPERRVWDFTDGKFYTYDQVLKVVSNFFDKLEIRKRLGKSEKSRNNGSKGWWTSNSGAVVDYIRYVVLSIHRGSKGEFGYFCTSRYIAFDSDPEYKSKYSCYVYYDYPTIILHTDATLVRLYGEDWSSKIDCEIRSNCIFVKDPTKFMYDLARSWNVSVMDYNRFLDYRWVVKYDLIYILLEYFQSGTEFGFRPEYGFKSSKYGTRSDKRLRVLKNMLIESGLLVKVGAYKYKFVSDDFYKFYKVVMKFLLEKIRVGVSFAKSYLGCILKKIRDYISKLRGRLHWLIDKLVCLFRPSVEEDRSHREIYEIFRYRKLEFT